jgi:hypothetical protein
MRESRILNLFFVLLQRNYIENYENYETVNTYFK